MKIINFEVEASGSIFRDAIWLNDDDQSTDSEIEDMKTTRFQNWLKATQPQEE